MLRNLENKNFNIAIINQQKNKFYLKKLIKTIQSQSKFNKIILIKKINLNIINTKQIDFLISFHNSEIISDKIIKKLKNNCINFHTSLLPRNRGGSPILWSAVNKESFGVTIHKLSGGLDKGLVCGQKKIKKISKKSTLEDMYYLLENEGLKLFKKLLPTFKKEIQNNIKILNYKIQNEKNKSYNSLKKSDEMINLLPNRFKTKIIDVPKVLQSKKKFEDFKFKSYSLLKDQNFIKLRNLLLKKILNIKNIKNKEINLETSHIKDIRNDNNLMIKVEILLKKILKSKGFKNIVSMQYPANIRVVNSNFDKEKKRDYDTRYLHSDAWSGAPEDSLNGFIYIYYEKNSPIIKIYQNIPKNSHLRNFKEKYKKAKIAKSLLKEKRFEAKEGNMALWPTHTIHKTSFFPKTKNTCWRISLDFRIKGSIPYNKIKKKNMKEFYRSKMNNDGVYWRFKSAKNIKLKIIKELNSSKMHSTLAHNARKKYLHKFYKNYL